MNIHAHTCGSEQFLRTVLLAHTTGSRNQCHSLPRWNTESTHTSNVNGAVRGKGMTASIASSLAVTTMSLDGMRRLRRSESRKLSYQNSYVQQICFVLFVKNAPRATMALAYAAYARSKGKYCENITEESLQGRCLHTSLAELANVMTCQGLDPRVLRAARRFEQEQTLHEWLEVQNTHKGLTPRSARILQGAQRLEHRDQEADISQRRTIC